MSEAVTAGTASAQGSTQASQSPQTSGNGGSAAGNTSTHEGIPTPNGAQAQGSETAAETKERILAEGDLDAYIEHTVNGKKEKIKVRDALKGYGLDKAANQKMQEASRIQKQQQQLAHLFNTDFQKFCEVTGTDPDAFMRKNLSSRKELAEEILAAEYERQQLSPAEREAIELKEQLSTYEKRELQAKQPMIDRIKQILPESQIPKGLEKATQEQLQNFLQVKEQEFKQGIDNLSNELLESWQKAGLPKVKEVGQWMAQVMSDYQKRTGEPLHPDQAAARVKSRFVGITQNLLSQMDAKAIQETLGSEIIEKLRNYDVEQVRSSGPQFGKQNSPGPMPASEPNKQLNQLEWRKAMGIG